MLVVYGRRSAPSGKALARELGATSFRAKARNPIPACNPLVLRWGTSEGYTQDNPRRINTAEAIKKAADKRLAFAAFDAHDVPTVPWTTDHATAVEWCARGDTILSRAACSYGGRWITVAWAGEHPDQHPDLGPHPAELYTIFEPTDREYRVHVVGDRIVRTQVKVLRDNASEWVGYDSLGIVKNWATGYVFKGVSGPPRRSVARVALAAVAALGLDYGAVDVGWRDGSAFVFEVNTAPKMSPLTLRLVAAAIKEYADA